MKKPIYLFLPISALLLFGTTLLSQEKTLTADAKAKGSLDIHNNLSFGLSSSNSGDFAPQILVFLAEVNSQGPFTRTKRTRDASKIAELEAVKTKTQVNKAKSLKIEGDHFAHDEKEELAIQRYQESLAFPYETLSTSDHLEIAEYFGNTGRYELANDQLNKILKHDPKNQQALLLEARFLSWQGNYSEAEALIDIILKEKP